MLSLLTWHLFPVQAENRHLVDVSHDWAFLLQYVGETVFQARIFYTNDARVAPPCLHLVYNEAHHHSSISFNVYQLRFSLDNVA